MMTDADAIRVLLVEEESLAQQTVGRHLEDCGLQVSYAQDGAGALQLARDANYDLAFTCLRVPGGDGLSLLARLKELQPQMSLVVLSAGHDTDTVVRALRLGAIDFLRKPAELQDVDAAVEKARSVRAQRLSKPRPAAPAMVHPGSATGVATPELVGVSDAMRSIALQIQLAASSGCDTILITGETGTGKELVAREIHRGACHDDAPFVAVSCPAIPDSLAESELFGHVRGSFTGATSDRIGHFAAADGGTLFLDEVGDLSTMAQAVLLRVLETRTFRPVGSHRESSVSVRVIAATNAPLEANMRTGRFRPDLYYRLNVYRIAIPPLRDRREDIVVLAEHFLQTSVARSGTAVLGFSDEAREALRRHPFPGNARELRSMVERAAISSPGRFIEPGDLELPAGFLMETLGAGASPSPAVDTDSATQERRKLVDALERSRWNRRLAAKTLGMPYSTLRYRIMKLGIK